MKKLDQLTTEEFRLLVETVGAELDATDDARLPKYEMIAAAQAAVVGEVLVVL